MVADVPEDATTLNQSFYRSVGDIEIDAIRAIHAVFEQLEASASKRIAAYFADRYEVR